MLGKGLLLTSILLAFAPLSSASANPHSPIDVIVDAGHGGIDSGTSFENLYEKDINLAIAKNLYKLLSDQGVRVLINRLGDYALSDDNQWLKNPSRHKRDLAQRKHLAVDFSPQMMLSLHVNWSPNTRQHGPIVLYQANNQSYMLAEAMQHSLNSLFKTNERPRKGSSYYLLKHSVCPTVIIEMGFISNPADRDMLTQPAKQAQIAKAIADAVNEYFLLVGAINGPVEESTWANLLKPRFDQTGQ